MTLLLLPSNQQQHFNSSQFSDLNRIGWCQWRCPRAAICRRSSVVAMRTVCQRLSTIFLRASTRVDNLDDMHDAICHAAARFRHDSSARCFVAHRHNLDVKCRFLRAATPFQLPLVIFYERVLSIAEAEADAVSSMSRSPVESFDFSSTFAMLIWRST
jgi:hypothetical protein